MEMKAGEPWSKVEGIALGWIQVFDHGPSDLSTILSSVSHLLASLSGELPQEVRRWPLEAPTLLLQVEQSQRQKVPPSWSLQQPSQEGPGWVTCPSLNK